MIEPDELAVAEGYAAWAPCYDSDGNPLTAIESPTIREWLGDLRGRRGLDLGCGTGRHSRLMAEGGASVVALDFSPEMLARARENLRGLAVTWIRHRLPAPLPFADSTFDRVVLGLVAEHLDELQAVLEEAARVSRPGGLCLLTALHPDRTAEGQRARFIDPATGHRRQIRTIHRSVADYLEAARLAGWSLAEGRTLVVPASLAESLPRARPYVGLALGWAACWRKWTG